MKPVRNFARVYYDDLMREYPAVYADDALLATWLRLLILAEKMWPAVPEVPRSTRPRAFHALVDSGLVIEVPPHSFRIKGLDAERTRRQDAARNAARNRWSNADAPADALPRRDETRRDEEPPNPPRRGGRRSNQTNPRSIEAAEREAERRRARQRQLEDTKQRGHLLGLHADEPDPGCPRCRDAEAAA